MTIARKFLVTLCLAGAFAPVCANAAEWYAQQIRETGCSISHAYMANDGSLGSFTLTYDKAGYHVLLQNTHWKNAANARQVRIWYGGMTGDGDHLINARGGVDTIPYVRFDLTPYVYAKMRVRSRSMMRIEGAQVATGMALPSGPMLAKFEECRDQLDAGTLKDPNIYIDLP